MNNKLSLNEYQMLAGLTLNLDISQNEALTDYGLGLTGEAGEVADIIKKSVFHGHLLDKEELEKELGDVLWYISALALTMNVTLEEVANKNIDKLRKRYPEGFDKKKSINRIENK